MVGVWIALTEATKENGAMHVLPRALDDLKPFVHFQRRDLQICDDEIPQQGPVVCCSLQKGGALWFSTMLPHGTPPNRSGKPRYAVQFHYIPKCFNERCTQEERIQIWGEAGKDVSC
eukprot:gnl/TRDRNA2_/TRDRNA2_159305_c1_seq3.p1 gnl/TRDRNA2_/TRDRNA2_159305_c1~~gnl/TRDRNA2_/TRDRNA2_159305_c1_seq3.p1  ORF type:complete len:117 (+),score=11.54 gnl/TRDRNA2_/TRDRNA2_159305_c1_seq3:185-535(+)